MQHTMESAYFMRPGFGTFRLEPERHPQFLLGGREREQRDLLLADIEGAGYAMEGHKAVVYGDYGRGKTHMCHNLVHEIDRRELKILPIYIKCTAYQSKEPFSSFFRELVLRLTMERIRTVAEEYSKRVQRTEATPLDEIVQSEEIALVMRRGLTSTEDDVVRSSMRWLGGETKVDMGLVSKSLRPHLADTRDFGAVMRGLAHMVITVQERVPVYLIDEAERLENVSNVDTAAYWTAALRELTELISIGLLFFVGALTRNNLPQMLLFDEVRRRIGVANYVHFQNPSRDQLHEFLVELFATCIRKGEPPAEHLAVMTPGQRDPAVPEELRQLLNGDAERRRVYPFEPDAFDEFVQQASTGELSNKPSEVLIRVQKLAQRAMRSGRRVISAKMVEALASEGI